MQTPEPMLNLYEQIVNSLNSGVIAIDRDGQVILANPAAASYLDIAPHELQTGILLASVPNAGPLAAVLHEVMRSGESISRHEITLPLPSGVVKQIGLSASVHEGPEPLNGVIVLVTDMTERMRLERSAELNRQLAALGELTAGVVHELRNPVSVISGMAELLIRKLDPADERLGAANTILREASALEKSISQFLGFARPFELQKARCTPAAIIDRTVQLCRRRAEHKGVALEATRAPDLALHADMYRVAQALSNVINNAIEAVSRGGWVRINTVLDETHLVFTILDDGPGIHISAGEDLFAPFFTKKEAGTGLGLTIAHRIIAAHEGSISYGNRTEGGACFTVRIPVKSPVR
ncbi:MAG: PAS domain-containing protein [Candidatus Hydrogenedentes bacterium]|nr:PAS domain-containing protein [Candidatus Hydrogenedentota bacterium]